MELEYSVSNIFERDYQMLELDRDADWKEARESYRRLVNRWHPDRFTARPREKHHAQTRFIEVTKSYNNLRSFHRDHHRLPLQDPALRDNGQSTGTPPEPTRKAGDKSSKGSNWLQDEHAFATQSDGSKPSKPRYWLWAIPVLGLIITFVLFMLLEQRIAEEQRENAIEVLRSTEPSKFLPQD